MTTLKISSFTSEAGHWYTRNGEPAYTVVGANGKVRNTTLRDARKDNLVPSVTTIINVMAKPGLDNWKLQQVLLAALTLPKREDEPEKEYIERIIADSKEQGKAAADVGTQIHAAIQQQYEKKPVYEYREFVDGCVKKVEKTFGTQKWICERSFAHELGFGGKCDMYAQSETDPKVGLVLDIKTKEFYSEDKIEGYDEHAMQLAAYRVGLGMPGARCANVFVSRNVPGLVVIKEWEEEEIARGWKMFSSLLNFWQVKNSHQ
jgi:hypothetical protein